LNFIARILSNKTKNSLVFKYEYFYFSKFSSSKFSSIYPKNNLFDLLNLDRLALACPEHFFSEKWRWIFLRRLIFFTNKVRYSLRWFWIANRVFWWWYIWWFKVVWYCLAISQLQCKLLAHRQLTPEFSIKMIAISRCYSPLIIEIKIL